MGGGRWEVGDGKWEVGSGRSRGRAGGERYVMHLQYE